MSVEGRIQKRGKISIHFLISKRLGKGGKRGRTLRAKNL